MSKPVVKIDYINREVGDQDKMGVRGTRGDINFRFHFWEGYMTLCDVSYQERSDNKDFVSDIEDIVPILREVYNAETKEERQGLMKEANYYIQRAFDKKSFKHDDNAEIMWGSK